MLVISACGGPGAEQTQNITQLSPTQFPGGDFPSTESPVEELPSPTDTPQPTVDEIPAVATFSASPSPSHTPTSEVQNLIQFPDSGIYAWELVLSGLNQPIGLTNAGDGSGRLFAIEQLGLIRIISDNNLLAEPFLDIRDRVSCCGERGLLGLAFHPEFSQNGYFFVNYTDVNGNTTVSRFQVSAEESFVDPSREVKLLTVEQPFANHNGGSLAFGTDGYLYIGLGDGGSGGDPLNNAQNTDVLLGKLLRLDVNQGDSYAIPPDNPFVMGGGAAEVWVTGLRNPWRFSIDRSSGDLFIGDVGQGSWEEIDYLPGGSPGGVNFGWNYREGAHAYSSSPPPENVPLVDPVTEYGRDQGYSVIGGLVYRGEQLPEWQGVYFYGDYGSGFIWGLFQAEDGSWQNLQLYQTGSNITSFGEDELGEIYYVDYGGSLFKLIKR
ncbi:MAG: PQQ-dependent sugar dehydrogenase [Chloroflexota bacterium]|nr:MAG: PQQ-dependent sugar dehydrogenase [Chloroflexota bacterium]